MRICPACRHEYCIPLAQIDVVGNVVIGALVKCASCGEVRHWTHWKTPAEHDARQRMVDALIAEMRTVRPGAPVLEP